MRKLNLTFPQEISEQLQLLCLNKPKICKKEGLMGWSSNDRIILVRKGYFQYYNLHPGFVEDDLSTLKQKYFKSAIRLDLIHEINYLPKNKIRKNFIELTFPKNKKISKMPSEQKEEQWMGEDVVGVEQQLEKWLFQFKEDVKEYIQRRSQEEKQKKRTNAKLAPLSPKQMRLFDNKNTPPASPTRKSSDQHHEKNIEQYVQAIQKTKSHLKSKAEMAEQQAIRKKKLKEKQMAQMLSTKSQNVQQTFSISNFWREYYRYYQQLMRSQRDKASLILTLQNQVSLLKTIQYFNTVAVKTVQNYIDQRCIGWNGATREFQNFQYYQGLWLRLGGKQINQEFLVNYFLNDILYTFRQVKQLKFRIPLMSFIKYKGHKVLVMCDMPFSELEKSEVYNLIDEGFDLQVMAKLKEGLDIIEDVLNVKSEPVQIEPRKKVMAPLGIGLKIFEYNFKKDKSQDQATLPNFYYLINPGIVFPLDFTAQKMALQPYARLRPNIVAFYRDYYKGSDPQLMSQAFMISSLSQDIKKHQDDKAIEASKIVQNYKIKELAQKLNQLELMFVDSYSIKSIMEEIGINMRYLKNLYEAVNLPYLREHILAEALARTIKKQFRSALVQLQHQQSWHSDQYRKMKSKARVNFLTQRKIECQNKYRSIAVDYLNLIFGKGKESQEFWKIIIKNCHQYYRLSSQYPPKIKPGMLFHAVLWHCGLKANFQPNIKFFETQYPFSQQQNVDYLVRVKTLDFPSFQIQKLFRGAPSIEDKVSMEVFKQSSAKLLKFEFIFQNTLRFSYLAQAAIAKLSNFNEYMSKVQLENPYHPILLPYYFANRSQYNFKKALQVLNFSLPQAHPLFISFYYQYSKQFQNDLLKKTALLLAVKNLGEFHTKTTDLYSEYYHQGHNQYRIKALRVGNLNSCQVLCQEMYKDKRYQSCLIYCLQQINKLNHPENTQKLGTGNYGSYLSILMNGLQSSIRINQLKKGVGISKEISSVVSSFKLRDHDITYQLFKKTLQIHLMQSPKKYFLYKMVLFALQIRERHEPVEYDSEGCAKEVDYQQRELLLEGLLDEYYQYENHSNWIQYVLGIIYKSFQYFNFLEDLFNNYAHHLETYNSQSFKDCLGYWDIFIRIYGQKLFKIYLYDVNLV